MKNNVIEQQLKIYEEKVKTNKSLLMAIDIMLSKEGIVQYTILQFIAGNKSGTDLDLLSHVGVDIDLSKIIIEELLKNGFIEEKDEKYYITNSGKSVIIASYFRALEKLF